MEATTHGSDQICKVALHHWKRPNMQIDISPRVCATPDNALANAINDCMYTHMGSHKCDQSNV